MDAEEKKQEEEENDAPTSPAWMTTYGDMMTLLMTFFILIMSFSTMEVDKFKMAMGSLKSAMGILGVQKKLSPDQSWFSPQQSNVAQMKNKSILQHLDKLKELVKKKGMEDHVEISMSEGEVFIQIKDHLIFNLGKADLKQDFLKILSLIAKTLVKEATEIKVEGHTDDLPIRTDKYPSNWELSFDRALSVLKYFVREEGIPPNKLAAAGFGEYYPIAPNNSPENRAKNRRVIINVKF